jgi:2'-5' RNA ligase
MTSNAERAAAKDGLTAHRMFFALWPDEPLLVALRTRIPQLLRGVSGKAQRPDQWHLTLVFLGAVPADRLPLAEEAASAVRGSPFEIRFDLAEHWRRPQVLCLSATRTPDALARVVADLRRELGARGFATEEREFRPHLTLARKVRRAASRVEVEALPWPAADFVLVESVTAPDGSRYGVRRRWPLAVAPV